GPATRRSDASTPESDRCGQAEEGDLGPRRGAVVQLFDSYSHYLAYGATDQETFRALRGAYTGVLVPGTIAAWQRQGTGGFVLALSATEQAPPYVIDPRFPLFQQPLKDPKASHEALADLLGDPDLIRRIEP